ncbi:MAG: BREX-3 system P-loop-containing protein BrxF [Deltaproteobacteria bacterium]|nr:BREX-3 system P-loop-containing protein BrxF [Deltaproteobacteria bacterium]
MADPLADLVIEKLSHVAGLYHRLLIIVAPVGAGKTKALREVSKSIGSPMININLELSRRMLDLTERQRALQLPRLLSEIVNTSERDVSILDNIEILFDISLRQDPLRILQSLSRHKKVIVAWSGSFDNEYMTYATPDHPEYKRYLVRDFLVVSPK